MIRVWLTLLAVLPMLVPQGICLCQFLPCEQPASTPTAESTLSPVAAKTSSCSCSRHSSRGASSDRQGPGEGRQVHASIASAAPLPEERSSPLPHSHMPGCPALTAASARSAVLPVWTPVGLLSVAEGFATAVRPHPDVTRALSHDLLLFTSTPIYLSHCALLI